MKTNKAKKTTKVVAKKKTVVKKSAKKVVKKAVKKAPAKKAPAKKVVVKKTVAKKASKKVSKAKNWDAPKAKLVRNKKPLQSGGVKVKSNTPPKATPSRGNQEKQSVNTPLNGN